MLPDRFIEDHLIEYLRTLSGQEWLGPETLLLEEGILDSLAMMDLMVFIESQLHVQLNFADLNADAFRTPASLARTIATRRAEAEVLPTA